MRHTKAIWLKTAIAAGFILAGVLLAQSFLTHRYVIDNLLIDHLTGEAGHYVSAIERRARDRRVTNPTDLDTLLDEMEREETEKIAWVRVTEQDGVVLAATDHAPSGALSKHRIDQILEAGGPPLGLLPVAEYEEETEGVSRGDLLIAYSDGVTEATSSSGADFGEEGVVEALRKQGDASPQEIRAALLRTVQAFTAGKGFDDDVTVVAARVK